MTKTVFFLALARLLLEEAFFRPPRPPLLGLGLRGLQTLLSLVHLKDKETGGGGGMRGQKPRH